MEQIDNIDFKIVYAFERISQVFRTLLRKVQLETSLSPIQSQILIYMLYHRDTQISISNFALEFSVSKATISDSVKSLVEKKIIKKEKNKIYKLKYDLNLTEKGLELAKEIDSYIKPFEKIIFEMNQNKKNELFLNLENILYKLFEGKIITSLRMCSSCKNLEIKEDEKYCNFFNFVLKDEDLRVDCYEYKE